MNKVNMLFSRKLARFLPISFEIENRYSAPICYPTALTILCKLSFFICKVSPLLFSKLRFYAKVGRPLNLKKPQTLDEKLVWLMLYWRHPLKTRCGDKYTMRSYVKEHGLGHILPKLIGVYKNSSDIDYNSLPERFVLKCTHGCGFNVICRNKSALDFKEINKKLDKWMKVDFSKVYGEPHYALMKPRIICENYLNNLDNGAPNDYKVYCFYGNAHCTMVCSERDSDEGTKFDFYDREWKNKLPYSRSSISADRIIEKPEAYEDIIAAAEKLSKPFPFVRMDFYSLNGKAIIGEMTFSPGGGIDTGYTDFAQYELGRMIDLPEKYLKY